MKYRPCFLWFALVGTLAASASETSAGQPPDALLDTLFPVLRGKEVAPPHLQSTFRVRPETTPACGLKKIDLVQSRASEPKAHVFQLLGDPVSDHDSQPKTLLISLKRMSVNADGSARAYHPDDPFGRNCLNPADDPAKKACAIDYLRNAEIHVYEHAIRVPQFLTNPQPGPPLPNPAFATAWNSLWSEISSGNTQSVDLAALFGDKAPDETKLYYSASTERAVTFDSSIIPFKAGLPCQYNEDSHGFFVAATSAHPAPPAKPGEECRTAPYLDALTIPFFVLPAGVFKQLEVGDVAIALIKVGDNERPVFGIVGDIGPNDQIGEGSIALLQKLHDTPTVLRTALDTALLDIDIKPPSQITSLSVLVLGGTRAALGFDYSLANIDRVARAALASWSAGRPGRLQACSHEAEPNLQDGTEEPRPN